MKFFSLVLVLLVLISCSKSDQTTSDSDTTAVDDSSTAQESEPPREPIKLTPEEMEKVAWAIFYKLHTENAYLDSAFTIYKEEFTTNGTDVTYMLLRHNGDRAGWHTLEQGEYISPQDLAGGVTEETGEESYENDENDNSEADDMAEEMESANQGYYGRSDYETYTNEIDTFKMKAYYVAYLDSKPESPTKTVKIAIRGQLVFENYYEQTMYGQLQKSPIEYTIYEFAVDLSEPMHYTHDELPWRAKMANLTEADLKGLSKDELGYIRNTIFAQHGHIFKTEKMINYFSKKWWYHPIVDDAAPLLNKFEKRNADFIKKLEG